MEVWSAEEVTSEAQQLEDEQEKGMSWKRREAISVES